MDEVLTGFQHIMEMTSHLSTDSSAPSLLSSSHRMNELLTGLQRIIETSNPQGEKLLFILSILVMQTKQIKKRDQAIIVLRSQLDSQQAIMEQIRSEQQLLKSAVTSFFESNAQRASAALPPPVILETPEPKTPAANPERPPSAPSVPELPSSQTTPTPASLPSYRNSIPVAHADLRAATADNRWKTPQHYMKTQRGGQLRRQGAFYGTPDWSTMTAISSAVPGSGARPPSPPASPQTQEVVVTSESTAGKSRADVRAPVEVEQETDAAVDAVKAAVSSKGDRASDASSRNSCKRCRDPDEQEARKAANRMNISSIVHTAPDKSSPSGLLPFCTGPSPARGDVSNRDDPSKRRRVSRDIVESDAVSDVKRPVRRSPRRG